MRHSATLPAVRWVGLLSVPAAVALVAACGLESAGTLHVTDGGVEGAADVYIPPPVLDAGCKTTGPCTAAIPSGWKLVLAPANAMAACPTGWTQHDSLSKVTAGQGTCKCDCNVTTPPACDSGAVNTSVSLTQLGDCGSSGTQFNFPGCQAVANPGPLAAWIKAPALGPTNGQCTGVATKDETKVTNAALRTCDAPAQCAEDVCTDTTPGWSACVVGTGACPAGFPNETLAMDAYTVACSSCGCNVNGPSTCTNTVLRYYDDPGCATEKGSVVANGKCNNSSGGGNVSYAKYTATLNLKCDGVSTNTATITPTAPSTICCK